jgi:AraC-like DNA-binding protein
VRDNLKLHIVQLHEPKQTLASDAARHLIMKMREIINYLHSDHLHFADTPSFSKFFSRLSGMSPKEYRKG